MWLESLEESLGSGQEDQKGAMGLSGKNLTGPILEDKENTNPNLPSANQGNTGKPPIDGKLFLQTASPDAMAALSFRYAAASLVLQPRIDPQRVEAFVPEIFAYLRQQEPPQMPQGDFMAYQEQLSERMREILIDWLVDVSVQFHLATETLYLSILYLDFFLSQRQEIYPPPMEDYLAVADGAFTKDELLHYESEVIIVLDFRLVRSTPLRFLLRFLLELTLLHSKFSAIRPSHLAAGAAYLSRKLMRHGNNNQHDEWPSLAATESALSLSEVRIVAREIYLLLIEQQTPTGQNQGGPPALTAVKRKYATEKYMRASQILIEHRLN